MCGIVGILSKNGPAPHREYWPKFINLLNHRGPDEGAWWANGPFFLGHRRLSIIDLEGGHQPMATADGRYVIVFNGEIYNYKELREELVHLGHVFSTRSDTEVLLAGYQAWGRKLPEKLIGMFALALADRQRKEIFLARDRFGEKPLYWIRSSGYFAFASEPAPLAALPDLSRQLNIDALFDYLCLNYTPGHATLLQGIQRLAPASWMILGQDHEEGGIYWSLPSEKSAARADTEPGLEGTLNEFQPVFDRAVKYCLQSDVPVGLFLSGGIDSSLIAESAVRQGRIVHAYCVDFKENSYSEFSFARRAADKLGLALTRVELTPRILDEFEDIISHADDPLADSSCLPLWAVSRRAAADHKVVLGGDGGDELGAGYLTYWASHLHSALIAQWPGYLRRTLSNWAEHIPTSEGKVTFSYKLRRFLRAADLPPRAAHVSWNGTWLPKDLRALMKDADKADGALMRSWNTAFPQSLKLAQFQSWDIQDYLPNDILTKTDRMGMAHGLEIRAPFLEHHLAEWLMERPDRFKISPTGQSKVLLRAAASKIFGPGTALRPKQGFSVPIHHWVRTYLKDKIADLLSERSLKEMGVFDVSAVGDIIRKHMAGRRSYGYEIWGLLVFAAWYRKRILQAPVVSVSRPLTEVNFETLLFKG